MGVPVPPKLITVLLDFAREQKLEDPDMFRVLPVKFVIPFEACKETTPQPGKVSAHLCPKSLNTSCWMLD